MKINGTSDCNPQETELGADDNITLHAMDSVPNEFIQQHVPICHLHIILRQLMRVQHVRRRHDDGGREAGSTSAHVRASNSDVFQHGL